MPFIEDSFSHTFKEAIHIATVHALYGNNHLQKEVLENTTDNQTSKHHNGGINEESQVQAHMLLATFFNITPINIKITFYLIFKDSQIRNGFILKFSPPPNC